MKQSTKQINLYLLEIVNSIMQSKTASPFGIRKVCAMIFDLVQRTFPENPVSLRYFLTMNQTWQIHLDFRLALFIFNRDFIHQYET